MSILKFLGKAVSKILPFGGGIVADIISPGKSQEEKTEGLSMLDPIAQFNRTMARPRMAIMIVSVYLSGVVIQWAQVLFKVQKAYQIVIPDKLVEFASIIVGAFFVTRGFEKILKIFKKKEK